MSLIVALPFCQKDHKEAARLLEWMRELDGHIDHYLFLVADAAVPIETTKSLIAIGKTVFGNGMVEAMLVKAPAPVGDNYHVPAAAMFGKAAAHIDAVFKWPWLWLEPDAVPLKSGWLDTLSAAYEYSPKRFMGSLAKTDGKDLPATVFFGTGIYPNCAGPELQKFCDGKKAFDIAFSDYIVPRAADTSLIFHRFGAPNDPPTFKDAKLPTDGPNVGTLDVIPKEAVLFHRNKDGSLIELLRKLAAESPMVQDGRHPDTLVASSLVSQSPNPPQITKRPPGRPRKNPQPATVSEAS